MTSNDISNFLTSMSEAKRAFDAEPGYQQRIHELEQRILAQGQTIAHREQRIHELKQADETLIQKLRSVEAERDDAGFRALEEADKVSSLLTLVHQYVGDGLKIISAVEGKESLIVSREFVDELKHQAAGAESLRVHQQEEFNVEIERIRRLAEDRYDHIQQLESDLAKLRNDVKLSGEQLHRPFDTDTVQGTEGGFGSAETSSYSASDHAWAGIEVDRYTREAVIHIAEHGEGLIKSAIDPTEGQCTADPTPMPSVEHSNTEQHGDSGLISSVSVSPSGQSEGPFAPTETTPSETAMSIGAETTTAVASSASGPERNRDESTRFTGRKYFNVTYFVPLHEWLNKGGAREDYYWRPAEANAPLPEPSRASQQSS